MASIIKQLSKEIINLISAGEVIEGPKNVIKELVENSIDAKATLIKIQIESADNKIKKMTVTDNGKGMSKEDILLSIEPHTTSKISEKDDLFNISTMGFRGEALASICSVSYLTIKSKQKDNDGYFYNFVSGNVFEEGLIPLTDGTIIEVNNLFYNTPARFKNLKSLPTEVGYITNLIESISLAHPEIKFNLIHNNNTIIQTPGNNNIIDCLSCLYGDEITNNLKHYQNNNGLYKLDAYLSNNNIYKNNKNYINIIVNNRVVQNQNLYYAITDAYKSIIPIGKYPIVTLNISCDPSLLDVNVHPSKLEIRFTDEYSLRQSITKGLRESLYDTELVYEVKDRDVKNDLSNNINNKKEEQPKINNQTSLDDLWDKFSQEDSEEQEEDTLLLQEDKNVNQILDNNNNINTDNNTNIQEDIFEEFTKSELVVDPIIEKSCFKFSSLKYLGQYNVTYLLLEDENDLYLIDQHAAMERVQYEQVMNSLNKEVKNCVELVIPEKMNFSPSDCLLIQNHLNDLIKIGLNLEFFGGSTFLIRTFPIWLPRGQEINYINEIIDLIIHNNIQTPSRAVIYEKIARTVACKKSIKANMLITLQEVNDLLNSMDNCKMPWTCPHGRPTTVKMTKYEIEKMFKRVI